MEDERYVKIREGEVGNVAQQIYSFYYQHLRNVWDPELRYIKSTFVYINL